MTRLGAILPLPISKNKKTVRRGFYNDRTKRWENAPILTKETLVRREEIISRIKARLKEDGVEFAPKTKTILECYWFRPSLRGDIGNFHDELCDCVKEAIGVDDRYFLLRDLDYEIDPKGVGYLHLLITQEDGIEGEVLQGRPTANCETAAV